MTCRHGPNDPNCSSHNVGPFSEFERNREVEIKRMLESQGWGKLPTTPDSSNYQIDRFERIGAHLVLRVKYPNCSNCSFEGNKVMVFLNVEEKDAIMWRKIDPHFRPGQRRHSNTEAPSPAARFPASDQGWKDALEYTQRKNGGSWSRSQNKEFDK